MNSECRPQCTAGCLFQYDHSSAHNELTNVSAAHTLFNTRVTCTPLLYNHGDRPFLCSASDLHAFCPAEPVWETKHSPDYLLAGGQAGNQQAWRSVQNGFGRRGRFSESSSAFCSQHMYAALFIGATVSWSSAVWSCGGNQVSELWDVTVPDLTWKYGKFDGLKPKEKTRTDPEQFGDELTNRKNLISAILGLKPQ